MLNPKARTKYEIFNPGVNSYLRINLCLKSSHSTKIWRMLPELSFTFPLGRSGSDLNSHKPLDELLRLWKWQNNINKHIVIYLFILHWTYNSYMNNGNTETDELNLFYVLLSFKPLQLSQHDHTNPKTKQNLKSSLKQSSIHKCGHYK